MEQFTSILKQLTERIQLDNTLDGNTFDLCSLVEIDENQIAEIQKETKGIEMSTIDEFWDLTEEIYKNLILETITPDLFAYFKKVQQTSTQKYLKIIYTFSPWETFELRSKNGENTNELINMTSISMKSDHAEDQIQSLLNFLRIDDPTWYHGLYDFDYSFNFQSHVESLFHDLAFSCWKNAKKETGSAVYGFIAESNGGSYTFSLDTGANLHELNMSMEEYVDRARS